MLNEAEKLFASYKLDEARPLFQKAAEEGEGRAYYFLGQYTTAKWDGNIECDFLDRVSLEKGAQAGDPLSGIAFLGVAPAEDSPWYDKHKVWMKELEEMAPTDMFAAYELGSYYLNCSDLGDDIDQALEEKGLHWLTWSAEKGYWKSCLILGWFYEDGDSCRKDYKKSIFYYEKAKGKGVLDAYYCLGACYYMGNGVRQDRNKAISLWKYAAAKGHIHANAVLGEILANDKNKKVQKEALKYTKTAAEGEFLPSMWQLGNMYENGVGTKKDRSLAKKWYQEAASLGHEEAAIELAFLYRKEGNMKKVFEIFKASAEQGHTRSMITLAALYSTGTGTEANPLLCKIWMQKAAASDSEDAVYAKKMAEMMKYMATPEKMMELLDMLED